jgi:hypothetical protein
VKNPVHLCRGGGAGGINQRAQTEPVEFSPTSPPLSMVSREEVGRIEYFIVPDDFHACRDQGIRYSLAIRIERVDFRDQYCTCFAQGTCPVCRHWNAVLYSHELRRSWRWS